MAIVCVINRVFSYVCSQYSYSVQSSYQQVQNWAKNFGSPPSAYKLDRPTGSRNAFVAIMT